MIPLPARALRWYSLHAPVPLRYGTALATWLWQRATMREAVLVDASLDDTLRISLNLRYYVDWNIYCLGLYESWLARAFLTWLRPDSVVLDVGAYIGQYTLLAAKHAPAGRVIAIEPNPETFARLYHNMLDNRLSNVVLVNAAASATTGGAQFWLASEPGCSGLARIEQMSPCRSVRTVTRTLDDTARDLALSWVDVIKIDTEGAEGAVLRGARQVLETYHPALIVEMDRLREREFGDDPEALCYGLMGLGYRLYQMRRHRIVPFGPSQFCCENVIALCHD